MLPLYLILAAAMLAAPSVTHAQEAVPREAVVQQADEGREPSEPPVRRAIPRAGTRPAVPPQSERAEAPPQIQPIDQAGSAAADQRRAAPRGNRPQGDNPRTGTAVPRGARRPPAPADRARVPDQRRLVVRPPAFYNNYYYYPRRSYPYGYGAFGLGYFYYDPYRWSPGSYSTYAGSGYYGRPFSVFDIGELRLQVSPRHAQVYVDRYYAGTVDDYDGTFQALKLESGPYQIEIVAPGYETLTFDVRISPGQKITYRGDLRRP